MCADFDMRDKISGITVLILPPSVPTATTCIMSNVFQHDLITLFADKMFINVLIIGGVGGIGGYDDAIRPYLYLV